MCQSAPASPAPDMRDPKPSSIVYLITLRQAESLIGFFRGRGPSTHFQNTRETKGTTTNPTRGPAAPRKPTKSPQICRKAKENSPTTTRTHPGPQGILYDHAEKLFIRFRKTKSSTNNPRARARRPASRTQTINRTLKPQRRDHAHTNH